MSWVRVLLAAALICGACTPVVAVEGSTAAGPLGGTDIRSATLPPPGVYGGIIALGATAYDFVDGNGQVISALGDAHLNKVLAGPFAIYVPDVQVLGGSVGVAAIVPYGQECGHLFALSSSRCTVGHGDPYVELSWSRSFGRTRPSRFSDAFPIFEGLTILLGFGTVFPVGKYNAWDATTQGLTLGNNIWDFAPNVAFTYTTPPILAEGTEVSAKLYWNNYLTNPATHYSTGSLLNLDFAVSERIGRFQVGVAGFYAFQVADDKLDGVPIPPDGRRAEVLYLGGIIAYDMPELQAAVKIKTLSTVITKNTVNSSGLVIGWIKKFR
jgi:hypothetical protein